MFQSAYKTYHSTETALIKVQNDILCAMDNNKFVLLLLPDLSAAFDTVDHAMLLSRLSSRFGVKGTVLAWFKSYLASRKQYVQVEGCKSTLRYLKRGVPQGSILAPLLYLLYTVPIADIINLHIFTQMTLNCTFLCRVELCVKDIDCWMVNNVLKLNH